MQVILLKDVAKVGRKYEIKTVSDGYAVNFLFPRKLAEPATPEKVKEIEARKLASEVAKNTEETRRKGLYARLSSEGLELTEKANSEGHLYKKITAGDIANAIERKFGEILSEKEIKTEPIKEVGTHTIKLPAGSFTVTVVAVS